MGALLAVSVIALAAIVVVALGPQISDLFNTAPANVHTPSEGRQQRRSRQEHDAKNPELSSNDKKGPATENKKLDDKKIEDKKMRTRNSKTRGLRTRLEDKKLEDKRIETRNSKTRNSKIRRLRTRRKR